MTLKVELIGVSDGMQKIKEGRVKDDLSFVIWASEELQLQDEQGWEGVGVRVSCM